MKAWTTSSRKPLTSIFWQAALVTALVLLFGCGGSTPTDQARSVRPPSQKPTATNSSVREGDLYAVVVGVSRYKHPDIQKLRFADKDAKDFADFLDTQKQLFRKIHLTRLINEDATRAKVEEQLFYGLRPAGQNDTVILFFAGHGSDDLHAPGEFFFLTFDSDPGKPLSSAVNMNRSGFMSRLDSKRVLLIADTCHSGGYGAQATRGSEPAFERFKRQISESEGKIILSAAKSNEVSIEKGEFQNGVFTHFLLKGLKGEADPDGNGVITLPKLWTYVYQKTLDETKGLQHPQKDGPEVGLFPLSVVKVPGKPSIEASLHKPELPMPAAIVQEKPDELAKLRASAEQGNSQAQFELALKYEFGLGVSKDKDLAVLWYGRAKEKGNKDAQQALARLHNAAPASQELQKPTSPEAGALGPPNTAVGGAAILQLADAVRPSVVRVNSKPKGGQDSGVIVSTDGLILTTAAVVRDADEIGVILSDNRSFSAKVLGIDPKGGLAIIKIKAEKLKAVTLNDSDHVLVGESVFIPSFRGEIIAGKIKAIGVTNLGFFDFEDLILMDTPVLPGDGGSPLVDRHGRVIGISAGLNLKPITAERFEKLDRSAGSADGGLERGGTFAMPATSVKRIQEELLTYGKPRRGMLGVNMQDVTESLAKAFGRPDTKGALISQIIAGGPADKVGIKAGDIVIAFDGRPILGAARLNNMIGMEKPGSSVRLTVFRNKQTFDVSLILAERTRQNVAPEPHKTSGRTPKEELGIGWERLSAIAASPIGLKEDEGIRVTDVRSDGAGGRMGLKIDDVILEIDGKPVTYGATFDMAVIEAEKNRLIIMKVRRGTGTIFLATALADRPQKAVLSETTPALTSPASNLKELGVELEKAISPAGHEIGLEKVTGLSVKRVDPDGVGRTMGLREGDLILAIDGKGVSDVPAFRRQVSEATKNKLIRLKIRRGATTLFLASPLG